MLVVYNLANGVSMVKVNGLEARVSNGDAGQQWVVDRHSFGTGNTVTRVALTVEVYDTDGNNNGMEYYLVLDTSEFDAACAMPGVNAVPSPVLGMSSHSHSFLTVSLSEGPYTCFESVHFFVWKSIHV